MGPASSADTIVQGSLCIGLDCTAGETYAHDVLRLKEQNMRIGVIDTSTTAGWPSADWELTFNDTTNGGAEYFAVTERDNGNVPFRIMAGTRNNHLFLEGGGLTGLGTSAPVTELHMVAPDSPAIRLEQDGSGGNAPHAWDLSGNEANFFVRDAVGGTLPLRILPGAPDDALVVGGNGHIGLGAGSIAAAALHLRRDDGTASVLIEEASPTKAMREMLRLKNTGITTFAIENTLSKAGPWVIMSLNNGELRMVNNSAKGVEFRLGRAGDVTISGSLVTGTAGSCTSAQPCDAVFDPETYRVPAIEDHARQMWTERHLPAVGPTLRGAPVDVTEKLLAVINELEHAHIYIEQLHRRVADLEKDRASGE